MPCTWRISTCWPLRTRRFLPVPAPIAVSSCRRVVVSAEADFGALLAGSGAAEPSVVLLRSGDDLTPGQRLPSRSPTWLRWPTNSSAAPSLPSVVSASAVERLAHGALVVAPVPGRPLPPSTAVTADVIQADGQTQAFLGCRSALGPPVSRRPAYAADTHDAMTGRFVGSATRSPRHGREPPPPRKCRSGGVSVEEAPSCVSGVLPAFLPDLPAGAITGQSASRLIGTREERGACCRRRWVRPCWVVRPRRWPEGPRRRSR